MDTRIHESIKTVNECTFALVNGIWELLPNRLDLCGIVYNVGDKWFYTKNKGRTTTHGSFTSYTEAMQAMTS